MNLSMKWLNDYVQKLNAMKLKEAKYPMLLLESFSP